MEGLKLYGGSSTSVPLQNESLHCPSESFESLWLHTSGPSLEGSRSVVNFENVGNSCLVDNDRPCFQSVEKQEKVVVDDDDNEGWINPTKKRRLLSNEQLYYLERSFNENNILYPERKLLLATKTGLHPKQVSIWFQNRKSRCKAKKIENDYGELKVSFDKLKSDHDYLLQENQKLKDEVDYLKNILISGQKVEENFGGMFFDSITLQHFGDMNLISNLSYENESSLPLPVSSVIDSYSTNYTDEIHSSFWEMYHSNFYQVGESNIHQLLTVPFLPMVEADDTCYHASSFNFQFPFERSYYWSYEFF